MNIAFIVSSAEPGRDGVGDYTRLLAGELLAMGHGVCVVALNDRFVESVLDGEVTAGKTAIRALRLPAGLPWKVRMAHVCAFLDAFGPDWMSLQFVPYGYHRKGLVHGLAARLQPIVKGRKLHIMFHELWIGGTSWKHRLVGALQRHWIRQCALTLTPALVQTSMPLLQSHLKTIGVEASLLPLAGNIPVNPDPGRGWFLEILGQPGTPVAAEKRGEYLAGGFFGTIYPGWEPEPFFSTLRAVAGKTGQKVCILSAGRLTAGDSTWGRLPALYPDFCFRTLGELSADRVSQYLQNLDFGIAATPWLAIGKSGATAAMRDHGLPVMVTRNDVPPPPRLQIAPPSDPLLILADGDVSGRFFTGLPRRAPRHSAQAMAAEFVRQMEQAQHGPRLKGP